MFLLRNSIWLPTLQLRAIPRNGTEMDMIAPSPLHPRVSSTSCIERGGTVCRYDESSAMAALASWRCCSAATSWPSWVAARRRATRPIRCAASCLHVLPSSRHCPWVPYLLALRLQVMIWDDHAGRCIGELSFRSQVFLIAGRS